VITLYGFGPAWGLPDGSPFVTKAATLLHMSGLPFRTEKGELRRAPKGKLPYIDDDGVLVADSTLIRLHLETRHGIDFDTGLTQVERGAAWAIEKLLEDHLYWIMVDIRWLDDANFAAGPAEFFGFVPSPLRPVARRVARRLVRRRLKAHGMGLYTPPERLALAERALDAVAGVLGDKPYLMGERPCGADATMLGFIGGLLVPRFTSPVRTAAETRGALVAHRDRMMARYYPDWSAEPTARPEK
jgi:glutathione S-transferase